MFVPLAAHTLTGLPVCGSTDVRGYLATSVDEIAKRPQTAAARCSHAGSLLKSEFIFFANSLWLRLRPKALPDPVAVCCSVTGKTPRKLELQ